jgi:mannose-6-phosphate isomerase
MYVGPLTFEEVLMPKPWGGRALARTAGKELPQGEPIGESWEVADHPHGMSVVDAGPCAGKTLRDLTRENDRDLVGRRVEGRFPLLFKIIDARDELSVQVHPDDAVAEKLGLDDPGKTEAWYILEARKGARIISGLKSKSVIPKLPDYVESPDLIHLLKTVTPQAGEAWLCRAGTVHALGPATVMLEIQQASDATLRLSDWGRVGLDGKPRKLHVDASLEAVGNRALSIRRGRPRKLRGLRFLAEQLISCDKFVMDRWTVGKPTVRFGEGQFEILYVVKGDGLIEDVMWPQVRLKRGRSVLIPAGVRAYEIIPRRPLTLVRMAESR